MAESPTITYSLEEFLLRFEQRIDRRFDELNQKMDKQYAEVNQKIDKLNEKVSELAVDVRGLDERVKGMDKRLESVEFVARSFGGIILTGFIGFLLNAFGVFSRLK